ncbi:hypothetical protein [Curtobacterium sp. PhB130]|uniref:hypothetical protein n=1 Tax=Curtobacterium sp. PhB130 TaxID=2485178 RepID=UPI0011CDEB48|nr:hypothetical protein [Curtobacterium sp. PhB130]
MPAGSRTVAVEERVSHAPSLPLVRTHVRLRGIMTGMGKNRRYGTDVSRAAINEFLTRASPVSLSPEEIGAAPVVEVDGGDTVDVWLRFVETRVQERAVVVAFTDRAVQVEVTRRDGSRYRVWVWRGAVTRAGRDR